MPLTYIVPEGMRAVAVNTKQVISAGGLVLPGDYVDVIFVAEVKTDLPPPLDRSHISQTILQNMEVLAVEQTVEDVVPEDDHRRRHRQTARCLTGSRWTVLIPSRRP